MVKTYHVVLLPEAVESLRQITEYLRRTRSDEVAKHVRKGIMEKIKELKHTPYAHEVLQEISEGQITYRRALQWSYRIIFTIEEEELRVEVVDVNHSSGDPQKLIDKFA
ncbi:MAG: type II toxin-antitoxin system RelE/ParE family toxin [Bacteroidota bacterium]